MPIMKFVLVLIKIVKKYLKLLFCNAKMYMYIYNLLICEVKILTENNNYEAQVPVYLFHQGNNARAYEYMGAHRVDDETVVFRVWAPNAEAVSVCGEFNGWSDNADMATRITSGGIWEVYVKNVKLYDSYKYCIYTKDGRKLMKSDPMVIIWKPVPTMPLNIMN